MATVGDGGSRLRFAQKGAKAGSLALELLYGRRCLCSGLLLAGLGAGKFLQWRERSPEHGYGQVRSHRQLRVLVETERRRRLLHEAGERLVVAARSRSDE